jgi:hypothetical protein
MLALRESLLIDGMYHSRNGFYCVALIVRLSAWATTAPVGVFGAFYMGFA